jgi:hypothetical protein
MFSRWIVMNITSESVTTFLTFLAGTISWSVYCIYVNERSGRVVKAPTSYSRGPGFDSQPRDWLS